MAWTGIARREHSRNGLRYPSDLTDREWALTAPFIPLAKSGGRRRTTDSRADVRMAGQVPTKLALIIMMWVNKTPLNCECSQCPLFHCSYRSMEMLIAIAATTATTPNLPLSLAGVHSEACSIRS